MGFVIGSHRVVTGNTGNHLTGVRFKNLRSDRMCKFSLRFMTLDTDRITTASEHGKIFTAMGFMTDGALFDGWMRKFCLSVTGKGFCMAGIADLAFPVFKKSFVISGMRRMAVEAAVALLQGDMAVVGLKILACFFVTLQTGSHVYFGSPLMTGCAAFYIGLVEKVSYQPLAFTAMRVVAGEAVFEGNGIILMRRLQRFIAVAGKTESIWFVGQQLQVVGLVGFVTDCTFSFSVRFMGLFIFFGQFRMTGKAVCGQI